MYIDKVGLHALANGQQTLDVLIGDTRKDACTTEGIFKVVINLTFRRTVGPPARIAVHLVQIADQELSMTLAAERKLRGLRKGFPGRKTLALKPELRDSTRCVAVLGGGGHNLHLLRRLGG